MSNLRGLAQFDQSPWLDNLRRSWLTGREITGWIERGVRGITSNPSIFQKAIEDSSDYDAQFAELLAAGAGVDDAYWRMVSDDISTAAELLAPVYRASGGTDGFVSVEVDPRLAHDQVGTEAAARALDDRLAAPNLLVKVPATVEGVAAVENLVAEGRSINVTLIFSLDRYRAVMEAYIAGLERFAAAGGDLAGVASVASFFISRVDTEVDRRLEAIGTPGALALRGTAALTQARCAYRDHLATFSGARWESLAARGAQPQRPLWASTSTKNPAYPDTLYVDALIGPGTVNTIPDATLMAFEDHGTLARTVDADLDAASATWASITAAVDMHDVAEVLEREGVAAFATAHAPRHSHHATRRRCSSRSPCCAATSAATARSPSRRPADGGAVPHARAGAAHRQGRRPHGVPRGAVHAGRAPEDRYEVARDLAARARLRLDRALPARDGQLVLDETGLLPHANAGALRRGRTAPAARGLAQPGDDDRDAARRPALPPWRARQDPRAAPRHAGGGGRARVPFTTGILVGIGETARRPHRRARGDRRLARRHGHVQEVIVQNFLPKPGTGMQHEARRARTTSTCGPSRSPA
jgi:transaldolase